MTTNVYVAGRAEGKTMRAVLYAHHNPSTLLVTFSQREADRLMSDYPLLENRVVSASQAPLAIRGSVLSGLVVDNAEIILRQMLVGNAMDIDYMTLTGRIVQ